MGNYIYMKGTVQPLRINITADNTVEQETTATESLKEQIKRIENNYISEENISPTVTVANIPCISNESKNKRFDFENNGRSSQNHNFSNDLSVALQNDNKVCAKTPKNSPRLHTTEEFKQNYGSDEDIADEENADYKKNNRKDDRKNDRISYGLCDSLVEEDMIKQEEDAFKEFYKMMRDIML